MYFDFSLFYSLPRMRIPESKTLTCTLKESSAQTSEELRENERLKMIIVTVVSKNLQYIGETKRRLKDRFNEHRRPIINPFCSYTPTAVSRHFLISGHAEDHMIEQLHTSCSNNCTLVVIPSERLVRHSSYTEEKHWSLQALTEEMKCNLI